MKNLQTSFRFLQIESIITAIVFVMPVTYLLFSDIGLSQFEIGLSQAIFMATALLLDVPTGWLADRFSRKLSNFTGDVLAAIGFIAYALVHSFTGVVLCEIIIGAGIAFTNGADVGLLKAYSNKLKLDYAKVSSKLASIRPVGEMLGAIIGGFVGYYNIRYPFLMTAGLFAIGAVLSLRITELGIRRKTDKHPVRDMYEIAKYSIHGHKGLRWRIFAGAYGANVTHTVIWLFTPMLLASGIGKGWLGVAWAVSMLVVSVGAMLAHSYAQRLSTVNRILVPSVCVTVAYIILGIHLAAATIGIYLVLSAARGWFGAVISPLIQQDIPDDIKATVISVASVARRVLYIPLVALVNFLGTYSLRLALVGSAAIYGVLALLLYNRLSKYET